MPRRTVWRRTAVFSCFLLAVGLVEYLIVVQLHGSLQGEQELTAAWTRSLPPGAEEPLLHGGDRERGGEPGEPGQKKDVAGGNLDQSEVGLARELRDLRVDRLRNFERRTGSLLADQQRRIFEARDVGPSDGGTQQPLQQQGRVGGRHKTGLAELLNLSREVDKILSPELIGEDLLKRFFKEGEGDRLKDKLDRLYDAYTSQNKKQSDKDASTKEKDYEHYLEMRDEYGSNEEEEEYRRVFDPEDFIVSVGADGRVNVTRKELEPEVLLENTTLPTRDMTPSEKAGQNIMLTIRTTVANHRKRLPLLFETWLTKVNSSQVFLVTDGDDPFTRLWTSVKGIQYVNVQCGNSYSREQLCCKAGEELALLFEEQNKRFDWMCHVDDDMYVNMNNLVSLLAGFDPRKDPVYLGRSGSPWQSPRRVKMKAQLSEPGKKYHFAVGGMYCLSRAMLSKTMQWIVGGKALSKTCELTREPEDVTVGFIVAMLNYSLTRTERINTHGLHLASTVDPYSLTEQVAISYGYGSVRWGEDPYNAVFIPDALFTLEEDESQFRSLHCLLYPTISWCERQRQLVQQLQLQLIDILGYDDYSDKNT